MTAMPAVNARTDSLLDYLSVDRYLASVVAARALKTAFETGLVDHLIQRRSSPFATVAQATGADPRGLALLLGLLQSHGIVEQTHGDVRLHPDFRAVLRYRDLLETKLDFAGVLLDDFADHFTALIRDPQRFVEQGRLFALFDYRRALVATQENYERTRAWMRLTSTLTRYEARACMSLHDFSQHARLLDVGGNSGEFALQACARHPSLRATVFDLPLVCEVGLEHVLPHAARARIGFLAGDLRTDPLPQGHDLIVFKSMLHDWPQEDAVRFLERAVDALAPGGSLLVFERGPIDPSQLALGFGALPVLLFFRSYRAADVYASTLSGLGMESVNIRQITLDTPFFLVSARKPGGPGAGAPAQG